MPRRNIPTKMCWKFYGRSRAKAVGRKSVKKRRSNKNTGGERYKKL